MLNDPRVLLQGITLIGATVLAACVTPNRATAPDDIYPQWVSGLIAELERQPVANPPAHVARYAYRGSTVYYLTPRCCDIGSILYDAGGTIICRPDGGIEGRGDGRCPDFLVARSDERIIWRDPRGTR